MISSRHPGHHPALRVVLTDHPWPDLALEHTILEQAGLELIAGPAGAESVEEIERLVTDSNPAGILTCWAAVSARAVEQPTNLRIVARMGVGLDNIAVDAATKRGAWVTNVPDYCVEEVSDHAVAMLLAHYRGLVPLNNRAKAKLFTPGETKLRRIASLAVGIIGFGRIGRRTAAKLQAFGCRLLVHSRNLNVPRDKNLEVASIVEIQEKSDVIVLHVPLSESTRNLVDDAFIQGCKRGPFLINVSRGGLVNNPALVRGLDTGLLSGAALDVIDGEPSPPPSILARQDIIVTPHVAYNSPTAIEELRRRSCEEVVRVLSGQLPHHPCNTPHVSTSDTRAFEETVLGGGVASDVRIVHDPNGAYVVKRSLPKLRVAADWRSDPSRSSIEVECLRVMAELLGQARVPKVLWSDSSANQFAMELIDGRFRNWKEDLMKGRVDRVTAATAGQLLGLLHKRSAARPDIPKRFESQRAFMELRVQPFFGRIAANNAELAPAIDQMIAGMAEHRIALVHGDYSPKNILADGSELVILDCEVAHWGDPRFDIAFCLAHLLLKALRREAPAAALTDSALTFIAGYRRHGPPVLDRRLMQLLGALLLARLEGDSPVEYLEEIDAPAVKKLAVLLLTDVSKPLTEVILLATANAK